MTPYNNARPAGDTFEGRSGKDGQLVREAFMDAVPTRPFDSIESAHEFIVLLEGSIEDAIRDVTLHAQNATSKDDRREQALSLALYKMGQLNSHMRKSRRLLNDLRTIRRLLFHERDADDLVPGDA
jgi:hypothetical protein